jgi:hypothetical protein
MRQMAIVEFKPLTQEQYARLQMQMEITPDPDTVYTEEGRHPELAELLRQFGYTPAGRYEAFEFGVKLLQLGYVDETTHTRTMDIAGQFDVQPRGGQSERGILSNRLPLPTTGTPSAVRVSKHQPLRRVGDGNEAMEHDTGGIAMEVPDFLKVGAPIWCGFAGWIEDIAVGETEIMVKVESPKRRLLNRGDEWLPYREGVMRPLTMEDVQRDVEIYSAQLNDRMINFNAAVEELRGRVALHTA